MTVRRDSPDHRPIELERVNRIRAVSRPLGLGCLLLSAAVIGEVVYVAITGIPKVGLLAMAAALHATAAIVMTCSGAIAMSMRATVSTGLLELRSSSTIRRNLLVLWNLTILLVCLGWFVLAVAIGMSREPIGQLAVALATVIPAAMLVHGGIVAVLANKLLRE